MRALPSLLAVSFLVAACASAATGDPSAGQSASAAPSAASTATPGYQVATGADQLIFRLADEGGFVGPGYLLVRTPRLALYGDGTLIVPGPFPTADPAPLIPNLRVMHVTVAEIQKIVAAADADGLLGPDMNYRSVGTPDASDTVFTTIVGGRVHTITAGGLGLDIPAPDPATAAAREKLLDFETKILDLSTFLGRAVGDDGAYEPTALAVFMTAGPQSPGDSTSPTVTWPLSVDPATGGRPTLVDGTTCVAVSGADLAAFTTVAVTATPMTVWSAPSGAYSAAVRPVYPNESACGPAAG